MKPVDELTDEELCREIAERLHIVPKIDSELDAEGFAFYEFTRDGEERLEYSYVYALDVEDAWSKAWQPDPECGDTALPNWSKDARKTLELCRQIALDHQWVFSLTWVWNEPESYGWSVFFEHRVDELAYEHLHYGHAATPALACARSALAALRSSEAT